MQDVVEVLGIVPRDVELHVVCSLLNIVNILLFFLSSWETQRWATVPQSIDI